MPYISLGNDLPGIVGLLNFRPETGRPLSELAETILRKPNTLSRGEREMIAAYVSSLNDCQFCTSSHAAFAAAQLPDGEDLIGQVLIHPEQAQLSAKLKALLRVAARVQQSGRAVTAADVEAARAAGASDVEIHDTVLIAAVFCMFNRYVDGLGALTPEDPAAYALSADLIVNSGYLAIVPAADA
jgi:uncharacterized peroxidase-related enzyme